MREYFTSESVLRGHPDKLCDQIADAILDATIARDPQASVACDVTACARHVNVMGEIAASAMPDFEKVVRDVIESVGYIKQHQGFDSKRCHVRIDVHEPSPDIERGMARSNEADAGAGDQGFMFGYACKETDDLMPLPITLAHGIARKLDETRLSKMIPHLGLDGKVQVTVEYDDGAPKRISTVIVSAQHAAEFSIDDLRDRVIERVIRPMLPSDMVDDETIFYVNPTGRFVLGGPAISVGLTGQKTMVDTYGGYGRSGGGAFSGKDPTKMDRSGAYLARYLAKNIVAAGLADRCETQLAYSMGLADPVAVSVDTFQTGKVPDDSLSKWLIDNVDMRPTMIIRRFNLRRPIYQALACYGHFGRNASNMLWEQTDLVPLLRLEMGV